MVQYVAVCDTSLINGCSIFARLFTGCARYKYKALAGYVTGQTYKTKATLSFRGGAGGIPGCARMTLQVNGVALQDGDAGPNVVSCRRRSNQSTRWWCFCFARPPFIRLVLRREEAR